MMNIKYLQEILNNKGIKAKILYIGKTTFGDYEIVFTRDMDYSPNKEDKFPRKYIIPPEEDILAEDYEDAVSQIEFPVEDFSNSEVSASDKN